jgi:aminoglycoside 2'-N-acetyltransferase I
MSRFARPVVQLADTADLDRRTLRAARALLDEVFAADMTDEDWEHAIGGKHALVWETGRLVGHASVVPRRLVHRGLALRTGYVEGVAVAADWRGYGRGAAMMDRLERVIRRTYELGALGASAAGAGFYAARGWKLWRGKTWALTPGGRSRTPDDDGDVYVFEVATELDLSGDLACDWREGSPW